MKLEQFNYHLPKELIAQELKNPRDSSRLMVVQDDKIQNRHFYDIVDYFKENDVLVINNSKVKRAKIKGRKHTGAYVELILTKKFDELNYEARIKSNSSKKCGDTIYFDNELNCTIKDKKSDLFYVKFNKEPSQKQLQEIFELPTPPYIEKELQNDEEYQTVYSSEEGSLAAPTAGLHFTERILEKLKNKGITIVSVTLHVDFGTFLPIKDENITNHKMHKEVFEISENAANVINNRTGRLIAVGTTSVRALESAADKHGIVYPGKNSTEIFIYPGYCFKNNIDALITNFHFPKSTLLLLVSAYYGKEKILKAYETAVQKRYRFFSLGDSMMLIKNP